MRQIADWLEKFGMSEYAQTFRENGIDLSVLPDLTDQDLEKLGVLLGHRRKLLRAIADLEAIEKSAPAVAVAAATPAAPRPLDTAERRQLTVMFSDLVGSTALSARLDPEDMREIVSAYQRCVADPVTASAASSPNTWAMACLSISAIPRRMSMMPNAPSAPGLTWSRRCRALYRGRLPLQVRVGIATGLVVVGDLIGSGEAQERGIVGETPNLAARLQALAEPNAVVIADDTRRLLGNLFELEDLGGKTSRASPSRCGPGRHCGQARLRAASRHCTRAA